MTAANAIFGWEFATGWNSSAMPTTEPERDRDDQPDAIPAQTYYRRGRDLFSIPRPLKKLFDRFPLTTYPANDLPCSSRQSTQCPRLYVFSTEQDAKLGKPSFHPGCLKWQTYLRFSGIAFTTVASNNHASPSGALPFLLPPPKEGSSTLTPPSPIVSSKLERWIHTQAPSQLEPPDLSHDAFLSLLNHRIRNAWLRALYLEPRNAHIRYRLYIDPCSSNPLVRATIAYQLGAAARTELLKGLSISDINDLYLEADNAFAALSTLLGDQGWFFGSEQPTSFDASVFAYTHLLLDKGMGWARDEELVRSVAARANLVRHRDAILSGYYDP